MKITKIMMTTILATTLGAGLAAADDLEKLDRNGDGKLSLQELTARMSEAEARALLAKFGLGAGGAIPLDDLDEDDLERDDDDDDDRDDDDEDDRDDDDDDKDDKDDD